ncbi:hypothetical protein [Methylobacterium sp. 190mf]|uniref:hypothetical protein n=1 Tax=Methylobacterium sp. 190mf TaxID=1761798 RepID=UPI0011B0DF1B|nr:hypothetical protein [Methylobacterium sp. 190mf]
MFSQTDAARWGGPHVVDQMRRGYPSYACGGFVAMPKLAAPVLPVPMANVNAPSDQKAGDT